MALEYAHGRSRSTVENICRNAPQIWVEGVNKSRIAAGREPLQTRGIPNTIGTDEQLRWNEKMLLEKRIQLLLDEAEALRQS